MSQVEGYPWAANRFKLERAITEVKASGTAVTEELVKAVYVRLLGQVLEVENGVAVPVTKPAARGRRNGNKSK